MHQGAATQRRRLAALAWLGGAVLAGCAGAAPRAERLDAQQLADCKAFEQAYRAEAGDYVARRDALARDPVSAAWLVRMFVLDICRVREGRPVGESDEVVRAAAGIVDPLEARAMAEIRALGVIAVPTLVADLLLHEQPQPRELGVELLAAVGAPAVPALRDVARTGATRHRRAAARTLGRIGLDQDGFALLREMATESDYTVRADALRGMQSGGPAARDFVIERLQADSDAFVRKVAAMSLAGFRDPVAARALVELLERSLRANDTEGERVAQKALQEMAGTARPRRVDEWQRFVREWPAAPVVSPGDARGR
jgi:HEAT repeat protein